MSIPNRTLLLSPSAIGMGTPGAESINSFLARVAAENDLTIGELLWGKAMGRLEGENLDLVTLRGVGSASLAQGSVSVSVAGLEFAEALARLSGRESVRRMNWSASTEGLSLARLMRKHQAWCPKCLAEDSVPYFRGLWDLELAADCPRHGCRLAQACTHCESVQRRYRSRGSLFLCHKCARPLASSVTAKARPRDLAIAGDLGDLVAEVSGGRLHLSAAQMKSALFRWAEDRGARSVKQKERLLGMSRSLVCYWRYTDRQPSLQRLLELSIYNGLPLLDVCRGNLNISRPPIRHRTVRRAWGFRLLTNNERENLRRRLAEFASRPFPPLVQHIAKELGVDRGTLKAVDPQMCAKITKLSNDSHSLTVAVRFIRFRQQVDHCVKRSVAEGRVPTMGEIAASTSAPGILRSPKCREYARAKIAAAQRELASPKR